MKTIPLTKGKFALVDDEDYEFLVQWKWHVSLSRYGGAYAKRVEIVNGKHIKISMHALLLRFPEARQIDHIDRNGLNNCKANLRPANAVQNGANGKFRVNNTSGFKGVAWHKQSGKWCARLRVNRQAHWLGLFASNVEAAHAYDRAALAMSGDFAATNQRLGLL